MTTAGPADQVHFGSGDHLCCVFDSDDSFRRNAVAFLAEGLARGEQLLYLADRASQDVLLDDLADLGDVASLIETGTLRVHPLLEVYAAGADDGIGRHDATLRALLESSRRDGFSNCRVALDVTPLVADTDRHQEFMAGEVAVGALIGDGSMAAMCGYDERLLGPVASDLACVHSHRHVTREASDPGFCLYVRDGWLHLAGEVDIVNVEQFRRAIAAVTGGLALGGDGRTHPRRPGEGAVDPVIDASGLSFIDIAATSELLGLRRLLGGTVRLVAPPSSLLLILRVLGAAHEFEVTTRK